MFLKDFYTVENIRALSAESYQVQIRLNPHHDIFHGHFPNNPVTPGVCMIQIIKDLSETLTGQQLFLAKSSNVKFMAIINPFENPVLDLTLSVQLDQPGTVRVKNVTTFEQTVALKLTNVYKIITT
ncbi:MAG: hypothetical protein ACTJHT_01470 [Sphingobacterium sp.]|uniref:3-hydroxyacyl-ACP dehydratase n=1 Tax=Sphingobacterium sp. JB170 TaxID=1434842 RepID=UPI00097EF855|nr:3-hydroxyacyl-ACP dehydratase [Sphingobacterium sp. JB170]SJN44295.1 (3R)-hydroxymyristoyl-[ACP] dehydratase [Sphingobacterium sp. JB170]